MEVLNDDEVELILQKFNRIDRKSCAKLCTRWRRLEASTRKSLRILDSQHIQTFLPRYRNLITLEIEKGISDCDLEFVAQTCPALQVIYLNIREIGCFGDTATDEGICSIADQCKDLRQVSLKGRKGVGNVGVIALMRSCPKITHLDLGFCNKITNEAVDAIRTNGCLEMLVLQGCRLVTDKGLASLVLGSITRTLKRLDLGHCNRITDLGVRLLQELTCLQVLNLEQCGLGVTDAGAVALGSIPTLEKLNLSCLINISDVSLLAIAKKCSCLKEIIISGCQSVTGEGVLAFKQHASLEAFILDACYNIHCEDIERLVLECPALGYLGLDREFRHWFPACIMGTIESRCQVEWL